MKLFFFGFCSGSSFTFQYVSILMPTRRREKHTPLAFTFQYVSILMELGKIKLCVYFRFTFQYVSILMASTDTKRISTRQFTFQYVSILISFHTILGTSSWLIYIPICLYFNPEALKRSNRSFLNLHSNMSLF